MFDASHCIRDRLKPSTFKSHNKTFPSNRPVSYRVKFKPSSFSLVEGIGHTSSLELTPSPTDARNYAEGFFDSSQDGTFQWSCKH